MEDYQPVPSTWTLWSINKTELKLKPFPSKETFLLEMTPFQDPNQENQYYTQQSHLKPFIQYTMFVVPLWSGTMYFR